MKVLITKDVKELKKGELSVNIGDCVIAVVLAAIVAWLYTDTIQPLTPITFAIWLIIFFFVGFFFGRQSKERTSEANAGKILHDFISSDTFQELKIFLETNKLVKDEAECTIIPYIMSGCDVIALLEVVIRDPGNEHPDVPSRNYIFETSSFGFCEFCHRSFSQEKLIKEGRLKPAEII